jgi:GTP-binding protein EngB required for normal cell division
MLETNNLMGNSVKFIIKRSDCGIFSCLNINKIVNEDNSDYTQEYYNSFRKRLYYLTLIIDNTRKGENLDLMLLEYLEGSTKEYRNITSKYF